MASRRAIVACVLASSGIVAGCTEKLVGFRASFASNVAAAAGVGLDPRSITLHVRKDGFGGGPGATARFDRAVLKMDGYLPVDAGFVKEADGRAIVTIPLPEDLVKSVRAETRRAPIRGEFMVPVETAEVSFAGVEHRTARMRAVAGAIEPVFQGPMTSLAESAARAIRGLVGAR
jgi:hypothetical protein